MTGRTSFARVAVVALAWLLPACGTSRPPPAGDFFGLDAAAGADGPSGPGAPPAPDGGAGGADAADAEGGPEGDASDDAPTVYECPVGSPWESGKEWVADSIDRFGGVSATGKTVAWTRLTGEVKTADRYGEADDFLPAQDVPPSAYPLLPGGRVALDSTGNLLLAVDATGTGFVIWQRSGWGEPWTAMPSGAFSRILASADGGAFSEPMFGASGQSFFYLLGPASAVGTGGGSPDAGDAGTLDAGTLDAGVGDVGADGAGGADAVASDGPAEATGGDATVGDDAADEGVEDATPDDSGGSDAAEDAGGADGGLGDDGADDGGAADGGADDAGPDDALAALQDADDGGPVVVATAADTGAAEGSTIAVASPPPVLYESRWDPSSASWSPGVAVANPELASVTATLLRRPTGASSDDRTLFFFDGTTVTERAAWREDPSLPYAHFADVPAAPEAAPNASCSLLYFRGADPEAGTEGVNTTQ